MDSKSEFEVLNLTPNDTWQLSEKLKQGWKIISSCGYQEENKHTGYVNNQQIVVTEGYPMIQYVLERNELARLTYG